jgi:hypothetical protein
MFGKAIFAQDSLQLNFEPRDAAAVTNSSYYWNAESQTLIGRKISSYPNIPPLKRGAWGCVWYHVHTARPHSPGQPPTNKNTASFEGKQVRKHVLATRDIIPPPPTTTQRVVTGSPDPILRKHFH